MKKFNLLALLLALVLLVCGCHKENGGDDGIKPMDELFEKTAASLEEGHIFFTGKVISVLAERKAISFYDAESEKNTFYKVEVTEDPFGCLPDRVLTLCVLGNSDNFIDRKPLEKEKEYVFDTTLWVQQEEAVLLLPTFYLALPDRVGEDLFYTDVAGTKKVSGSYADYWARLKQMAEEAGYGPQKVLDQVKGRLQDATGRNEAYFEGLKFENLDRAALARTVTQAKLLLEQANQAQPTWEAIKELLK